MKFNTRKAVPPKIRTFIDGVIATPLENIEEPLKSFVWEFEKGDFHHWVDLFKCFDKFFEKYTKLRKDLLLEDDFLGHDPPFPKEAVLQILRVIRIILDNCTNKHFYSVFEHHLSSLLASTDADVVEACLQTCAAFIKKSFSNHVVRDASLRSKLFSFAQGWGGKEEGLGLVACALETVSNPITQELGSTLHFEFYVDNESSKGLQIIHLPQVNTYHISDHELMQQLVNEYKVPANFRFALLTRLCFARAFGSFAARQKYTCIRLLAFIVFVEAYGDDLVHFFNTEPEFINELVNLLAYQDTVHEEVRVLCLISLVALCQYQLHQPKVLSTVTAGAHRGILSSLTQKAIDAIATKSSNLLVVYAEALISLITVLVSSTLGCATMCESGYMPILLPLLKDTDPQHLHLVTSVLHVMEAFMDYSNSAATFFRDLGGLNDTICRLKIEVSHVENGNSDTDNRQSLYSDALVTRNRQSLMKALLRAISLGTYAPGTTSHLYLSEESLLPYCLCAIFKNATAFGGGVFSLASTVMCDLIQKEPTCFSILEAAGIPSAFLAAVNDGVLCSSEAIACIPQCLDALCLNNNGLQAVKDHKSLRCLVKIFTTRNYIHVLTGDAPYSLSSGLDELIRHASSLRGQGVDVLIEILNTIEKLGSGIEIDCVPMETDAEDKNPVDSSLLNVESCLPFFVHHAACLLDNILQSSDTCRVFIEKKGVEAVLKLLTLPLMPLSVSVGQSVADAFKSFSSNHSGSLARSICTFMKEHLKSANTLLVSLGGMQVSKVEDDKRSKVMRCLSNLEGILSFSISITKKNTNLASELGASDGELFRDLGVTFKELLWQQSMCCDLKIDEKQSANVEHTESGDAVDDITIPGLRNRIPVRDSSHSRSALETEFLSIVQRSEVSSQQTRQLLAGIGVGRTRRHVEPVDINSNVLIYNNESTSSKNLKKQTPEILVMEILNKLASTLTSFFRTLVKGFTPPNRQRAETASISAGSKGIGTALAKVFVEAFSFSGYTANADLDTSLTWKCRYVGKVVDHMGGITMDRRRTCYTVMINSFYAQGTFKELLNTFVATSQLLWTLPHSGSTCGFKSCLLNTLDSYCNVLELFVNPSFLLPPAFTSHSHLVIQPVAVGLSIGLFPVPKDPKEFVRMLQSQVLDVILPVWNHTLFPGCNPGFVTKIVTLLNHMYSGVSDVKCGSGGATNQRFGAARPPDEAAIATIMEMGFTRRRAEEALRCVERNSVEMATEWLFSHPEDHLQEEDDEMAEALALSLGSSSETPKSDNTETSVDSQAGLVETKTPAVNDILATVTKLVQSSDSNAFLFTDLFITLCKRDKGEDRQKVVSYLIRQMKFYPLETSKEVTVLCTISHTLALLLTEDVNTREIAAENGVVSVAIDILTDLNSRNRSREELPVPKCISALLLILVSLSQLSPKIISESITGIQVGSFAPSEDAEKNLTKIYEKSTGYLTIEEGKRLIAIVTDMIKHHVPSLVMQAVLLLCARLTKSPSLALYFLENGGVPALLSIPTTCYFVSYDSVTSAIIRHLIEDPQTLQTAMELEIRQILSASQYPGRILPRVFLTSVAPLISRDPEIFMKAASTVCQVETLGGKTYVSVRKPREKEKGKLKVPGVEIGVSKGQKKIHASLTGVIHHMIEILMENPLPNSEKCTKSANAMEVDEPATSKGKIKVDETRGNESESILERSAGTAKATFVLKLLSDILLMSTPAVGIVLKLDLDMCQSRGSSGVVYHIVHQLLHPPVYIKSESDVPRVTLSKNTSRFLVVLCGRSSEGRRRIISELVKALCSLSDSANNSSKSSILPDKKLFAFVDLVHSIFSKSSFSGNLVGSADITKAMIDGGMIPCLSAILRMLDLDHSEAPKVVNIILKVLEGLTRAANASELRSLSDLSNEKISVTDNQTGETNQIGQHEVTGNDTSQQLPEQTSVRDGDDNANLNHSAVHELRVDMEDMDNSVVLQSSEDIEMNFDVDGRDDNNTGDEDDDMGDDDDEHDVDGDDEDEHITEDGGPALMSPADTDGEDHDAYNDDMVDDFQENPSIEMRWREALLPWQHRGDSRLMDIVGGPFQDLSGARRQAFERRIQHNRTSESGTEGNGLRHPLLSRPSQSQSSDIRPWSGSSDVARYNMFDAHVLPSDDVRSSGVAPASLGVFPVGLESTYAPERRGIGDGQWDDGQPQEAGEAAVIARTVEDHFMSHLHSNTPLHDDNQLNGNPQPNEGDHGEVATHLEPNQMAEGVMNNLEQALFGEADEPTEEDPQAHEPVLDTVNTSSNSQDNMEIGEGSGSVNDQEVRPDTDNEISNHDLVNEGDNVPNVGDYHAPVVESTDVDMNVAETQENENGDLLPFTEPSSSEPNTQVGQVNSQTAQSEETGSTSLAPNTNGIDPSFLEALPEDLRAEVLASQQAQSTPVANVPSDVAEDIDPEFLAALPPDIQTEVLAQQRAQRIARQAEGQPVDMDNASIIATLPADLRHEVLLTYSESVISSLPSPMIAEAQMLRDRVMSSYQARMLVNNHRLNNQRNGSGFERHAAINRAIGVTIGHKASSMIADSSTVMEINGEPLLDTDALKALLRLLRLAHLLGKELLQRLLLNLCAHTSTRGVLVYLLLDMIKTETEGPVGRLTRINSQRLYGCRYNVVYGRSQLVDGLPPLVLIRILEVLTYLATNHSCVADNLFYFDSSRVLKNNKGKEKVIEAEEMPPPAEMSMECDVPILLFTKLLNHRNISHLEQVLGLFQVVVHNAVSKLDCHSHTQHAVASSQNFPSHEATTHAQRDPSLAGQESGSDSKNSSDGLSTSTDQKNVKMYDIFMKLPQTDLHHLCTLLGREGLSDKVYTLTEEILKKLASIAPMHRNFFIVDLSDLALSLSSSAIHELGTLRNTQMLGHSTGSIAGASVLRTLQTLNSLTALDNNETKNEESGGDQVHATMWKLNVSLEPLWQELSECISVIESQMGQGSLSSSLVNVNVGDPPLPPEAQRLMPFIEALLVLYEKLQTNNSHIQEDNICATASEVKRLSKSLSPVQATDVAVTFSRFSEKHRRLLNAFVRQDPTLLEKSLSMLLQSPRLLDFDNKRAYFRSRISNQNEEHLAGSLRISVRRAYLLEDSYHQLRMRPLQDMKGRLNVHFQGEEGIDAGGLTREWYQLLSRVIFDKGALLFTTSGNNATFQPNPNSVYQNEHLSYFKFVGRVVAKALFDGQLLDVYFTRSFYKHILGVKVTYHDIEAVDPDYYKNLKWMLENDVSDIPDLTFSMDADEEKHILYEKTQVTDHELKPGGGNIRVTEETKHEYVDLVADHILTNAIRPQINSFLTGFSELIPRELISIFNDKELELLISGLPEIDLNDLKANTEYSGYTATSRIITWFWDVVNAFNREDRARMIQFVTGTSKVPLEGFKALQGISGPQKFQIHKAYGSPERLPSAHTCFNQLDLPEYTSKAQLQERLMLAIHEASEGFGFG